MNTELLMGEWNLEPIPLAQREAAVRALEAGHFHEFFNSAGSEYSIPLLWLNAVHFERLRLFEPALLYAFTVTRTNKYGLEEELCTMFGWADRKRLRDAGQPLPGTGPFTLYRGVAGKGWWKAYGYSWTPSLESAKWFAERAEACFNLCEPAVYRILATEDDCLRTSTTGSKRNSSFTQPTLASRS